MPDDSDWKGRYLELAEQAELERVRASDNEQLLCQAVTRLTVAAGGADGALEPHLRNLRNAVRRGVDPSLKQRLAELSDALVRAGEPAAGDRARAAEPPPFCRRLGQRLALAGRKAHKFEALCQQIISNDAAVADDLLDDWLQTVSSAADEATAKGQSRFLDRLFGKALATSREGRIADPNAVLLSVLQKFNWPGQWSSAITGYQSRLAAAAGGREWADVIEELSRLVTASFGSVQSEIRDAEGFLADLTQRLHALDELLTMGAERNEASLEDGRALGRAVSAEIDGIGDSVRDSTELAQLKRAITVRLDAIQAHTEHFLREEERRYTDAQGAEQTLRQQLDRIEKETESLRTQMLEAHRRALIDALTGLPNRMAYEERLAEEFARWRRFHTPLTMLVWDIDNFKQINDRFGHQAGDKALKVIARTLHERLRETDFIARFGGEEFVALLCGAGADQGLKVAEEMRDAVARSGFHSGGAPVPLTVSCGIAEFGDDDSAASVFARADKALYRAKAGGKNRCVVAAGESG